MQHNAVCVVQFIVKNANFGKVFCVRDSCVSQVMCVVNAVWLCLLTGSTVDTDVQRVDR